MLKRKIQKTLQNYTKKNEDYHIKNAILFSNDSKVQRVGKLIYMPIYYVMFLQPSTPDNFIIP